MCTLLICGNRGMTNMDTRLATCARRREEPHRGYARAREALERAAIEYAEITADDTRSWPRAHDAMSPLAAGARLRIAAKALRIAWLAEREMEAAR